MALAGFSGRFIVRGSFGLPSRLEGKEAIRALLEPFLRGVSGFRLQNIRIYRLANYEVDFAWVRRARKERLAGQRPT